MLESLKQKYRKYLEWQQQPYQVKPISEEEHECATCGTHYQGNYCPRCGQSSAVGRYSFKKAFLLFLDVWGLGNRGMFRSLRDLVLRYMIRDYLSGMQMAYFPPFKMFFLLLTFSVVVNSGLNVKLENKLAISQVQLDKGFEVSSDGKTVNEKGKPLTEEQKTVYNTLMKVRDVVVWMTNHQTIVLLLWLLLFSGPLYLFFRHCPAIPDLRYSEFFVAMVYTNNMMTVFSTLCDFLCLGSALQLLVYLLSIIPMKQLSGYGWWRTLGNIMLAFVIVLFVIALLLALIFAVGLAM